MKFGGGTGVEGKVLTLLVYGRLMGKVITMMEIDCSHQDTTVILFLKVVGCPGVKVSAETSALWGKRGSKVRGSGVCKGGGPRFQQEDGWDGEQRRGWARRAAARIRTGELGKGERKEPGKAALGWDECPKCQDLGSPGKVEGLPLGSDEP